MKITDDALSFSEDWGRVLAQDEFWVDASGRRLLLDGMEPSHCTNVMRWIIRVLPRLAEENTWNMVLGPGPSGDMANDAFDHEMAVLETIAENPAKWVADQPLFVALERRSRGLPASPGPGEEVTEMWFEHRPQLVRALKFEGDITPFIPFVGDWGVAEATRVSGPGPCRGMQEAVHIRTLSQTLDVPVGWWLVVEGVRIWRETDTDFTRDYPKTIVEAEDLCFCGLPVRDETDHDMCHPGMEPRA